MTKTIVIKKEKGQPLSLYAEQIEDNIVLTKVGDKTSDAYKRKLIIETMNIETYHKFIQIEVKHSIGRQIIELIKSKI